MCAEKLGSLALSFEDHLVCWLLAECSPPAAQAVKDDFLQIIASHFFSGLFEILVLPAPPGSPQLLVWWISALSVLTLTDEKGGGPWGSLGHPPCTHAETAFVWCAELHRRKEPVRGMEPECKAAVPQQPAFICCLLCLQRGWRGCRWSWELSPQPISAVSEDGVGMQAATPDSFVLLEGAARGI